MADAVAWTGIVLMALFNILSAVFFIGVNKQMLTEVMRRVTNVETGKADREFVILHIDRLDEEQSRLDREITSVRHDVKNLLQRGVDR